MNHWLVTLTAHLTAQAWIIGGFRHAEWFDTLEGRQLFAQWSLLRASLALLPSPFIRHQLDALILRHRTLDLRLARLRPDAVIEIGAGLSPRGVAYAEHHRGVDYVEIDLPDIVELKRRLMRHRDVPDNYRQIGADVERVAFEEILEGERLRRARLVVISEGLMPYLPPAVQRQTWRELAHLTRQARFGAYLLDMYPLERLQRDPLGSACLLGSLSLFTQSAIAANLFDSARQVAEELRTCGFARITHVTPDTLPTGFCGPLPWLLIDARPQADRNARSGA